MKIQRTIPPTAAPLYWTDLWHGLSGVYSGSLLIHRLEEEIKEHFGVSHVFLVSSGKAALTLILLALKSLSRRTEVIIPAYTCFSVPSAVVKAGLKVTLCDIDSRSFDFDQRLLEAAINEDTLCVIPHHLFGVPSDIDRLQSLCQSRGVLVVEDAAQAMGGSCKGRKLGTLGDVGFFSLGRGKNITCGSGGIIVTNSTRIADAIARHYANLPDPGITEVMREFFQLILMTIFLRPALYWFPAGMPFLKLGQTLFYKDFPVKRLSGWKAGLLRSWRRRLLQSNQTRAATAAYFTKRLGLTPAPEASIPYLRLPVVVSDREERDTIYSLSRPRGLGISLMYPTAINEIQEIRQTLNSKHFPSASRLAERLLTIPTHHLLSEKDKSAICELAEIIAPSNASNGDNPKAGACRLALSSGHTA